MKWLTKLFIVCAIASPKLSHGQRSINVNFLDTLELAADEYQGTIQWEQSSNGTDWQEIANASTQSFNVLIEGFPTYFRARIEEDGCSTPHYSEEIEILSSRAIGLWSDEATWGDIGKPEEGDVVTIPSDLHVILDEIPPQLGGLIINGVLEFDEQDIQFTSEWILVDEGILVIGSELNPHTYDAVITLNDPDPEEEVMGMGTRGLVVINSGRLELHGATPDVLWTKMNEHGEAGATSVSLMEEVDWKAGDEIVIAPTDYYEAGFGASVTQRAAISSLEGNVIMLDDALNAHRWGLLQYPTPEGMSLTPENVIEPPVPDTETTTTPLVLDERAEVGLLTRNIVIQAPEDPLWENEGFGVHTMIMPGGIAHVEGVEFKRAGQAGRIRRYPFHWHMLSYSGTETFEDATGQYLKNSSVNTSRNRGIVIHGTNGVLVQNNIVFDVRGHGIFFEDGVERRNVVDGNLVLHVRNPPWGLQLMEHEVGGNFASSGFWISNPDNIIINNTTADCETFGYWLAFSDRPWGLSSSVLAEDGLLMRPNRILFDVFDNNTAHSNKVDGIHLDNPQIDEAGNTNPLQYLSTADGRTDSWPYDALRRFALSRFKVWKNRDNGAWDRGVWTDIYEVVSADNCGRFFAGSGTDGVIERSLVVGTSLNHLMNGTDRPSTADGQFGSNTSAPSAFATYHGTFSMRYNVVLNFPVTEHKRMGVFATDDYYLRPVENGNARNYDNLIINSHPGVKLRGFAGYHTFASALWDPYGFWGAAGSYFVYDDPFLTYGKEVDIVELGTEIVGGVSVDGPFYGFSGFVLYGRGFTPPQSQPGRDYMAIHVNRLNPQNLSEVVATWSVDAAQQGWPLDHMRDFATTPDGIYELTFPESDYPTDFQMFVENMLDESDTQVLGIEFDGTLPDPFVQIRRDENWNNNSLYEQVGSLQEVIDSEGETWWRDIANHRIWIKIRGGVWEYEDGDNFEAEIYERMTLRITYP